jgi:uncharacterized protein (TIGR02391 family)
MWSGPPTAFDFVRSMVNMITMPKRRDYREPNLPTISLEDGKRKLLVMREKGVKILENRPLSETGLQTWSNTTLDYIQQTFGENSRHLSTFIGQMMVRMNLGYEGYSRYDEQQDAEKLNQRVQVLEQLVELIDIELGFSASSPVVQRKDFWSRLHGCVVRVSKARFEAGHYADAVEAAFKELNSAIKQYVREATGSEFDGVDLMNRAFSPTNPIIRVADLSTKDGENMQKGYMQIFSGAMSGIRNPKAHSNVIIDEKRAIHHLHVASLLFYVFDGRL